MKNIFRNASSFIAPVVVCLVLPYLILRWEYHSPVLSFTRSIAQLILGAVLCAAGLAVFVACARLFYRIGKGSIMPWDPTRKLIVAGPFRYVRNPVILSLIVFLAGEALLFSSAWIAVLAALFFFINTAYFMASEEPGLEKRFGAEYVEYKKNVPMWIPRLKPWGPK